MNEEKLKDYINEKIAKYVGNTIVCQWKFSTVDTANYWCGYIKALKDLKDFLEIRKTKETKNE